MAYDILDNRNNTDMEKGYFASLTAVKGEQFGREVFSSIIKFKDLADFLEIFPEVQRDIIPRKVASIRRYILSESDENLRFFSSITVSCKGHAFYDGTNKRLALDVANTKLSINDGQHRFEAIRSTLAKLEKDFQKSKDKEKTERIKEKIDRLQEMVVPIVIFNGLEESEEKQLFHDLNNLAQRPSRNANIKLSQTDYIAKISREVADSNQHLIRIGVEKEKGSIHRNNPNTVLLTSIYNSVKYIVKSKESEINENTYPSIYNEVNFWFNNVFETLPHDLDVKGKYVLDKSYGIPSIFKFIAYMLNIGASREAILDAIGKVDYQATNKVWEQYGGRINTYGRLEFSGSTSGGERAIYNILLDTIHPKLL